MSAWYKSWLNKFVHLIYSLDVIMETYPALESNAYRWFDNLNEKEIANDHSLIKRTSSPESNCEGSDSKRRVTLCTLSPVARKIPMRPLSPPFPEPMDVEESDSNLLPHQQCIKDFRLYLIYRLSSPLLLSSVIESGHLTSEEKQKLQCRPGPRCQMRKLLDIVAHRKDRILFDVLIDVFREKGFTVVYNAMQKRADNHCEM